MTLFNDPAVLFNGAVLFGAEPLAPIPEPDLPAVTLDDLIGTDHRPCARLLSLDADGTVRATWEGDDAILEAASVDFDATRYVRRSGSAVLADPTLAPLEPGDPFHPGERFRLERGAWVGSRREFRELATLVVTGFAVGMDGRLSITGEDPMSLLAQPFGADTTVARDTPAATALRELWEPVLGDGSEWDLDDDGRVCPLRVFLEDDDRLAAGVELMASLGLEVYSDRLGSPVLRPIPDPATADTAHVFAKGPGSLVLDLARSGDARPYNRVIVVVEAPDSPVIRAVVDVTDPDSPLHADRIGIQTAPIHRLTGGGQAEANAVARALLNVYAQIGDRISGAIVPDQRIEAGDVIEIEEAVTGTSGRWLVERVSHPVTLGDTVIDAVRILPVFAS